MCQIVMKEDTAKDALNDEEFPGIINLRLKLYWNNPPPEDANIFDEINKMELKTYTLRVFLYICKDLPAADETGTSDPFVKFRARGNAAKSKVMERTLNPGFFQVLDLDCKLYDLNDMWIPPPCFSALVYDADAIGKKDLLGRVRLRMTEEAS